MQTFLRRLAVANRGRVDGSDCQQPLSAQHDGRSGGENARVVDYSGSVDFRDGLAANLALDVEVEARGALSADGTRLRATRIDVRH